MRLQTQSMPEGGCATVAAHSPDTEKDVDPLPYRESERGATLPGGPSFAVCEETFMHQEPCLLLMVFLGIYAMGL